MMNQQIFDGTILVSGDGTTVTFEDQVLNRGTIAIGPNNNVVNFLSDFTGLGGSSFVVSSNPLSLSESAAIVVGGTVTFNPDTSLIVSPATAPTDPLPLGTTISLVQATQLNPETQFTDLQLPALPAGQYWDLIYDTMTDEIRLELIESTAFGADFTGDGLVNSLDIDVWSANVGITSGASVIQGDADLDGDVDLDDYLVLMDQIVAGVPVAVAAVSIPEPSALLLAMLAAGLATSARKR